MTSETINVVRAFGRKIYEKFISHKRRRINNNNK
jgi:hypothetical protein